jgi:putative Mn2+ efflux pump MntP
MTPSDPNNPRTRGDSALAFSVIFFSVALLCLLLGWAQGVRKDTTYLHIPENGSWLLATGILVAIGLLFLVWSRLGRR